MNLLSLAFIIAISTQTLIGMEVEEIKPSPMSLAQTYYHFAHDLLLPDPTDPFSLLPEIAHHICSLRLRLSNVNLETLSLEIKQSCEYAELFVTKINTLIGSCGYQLANELCELLFPYDTISICDIKTKHQGRTSLHYAIENRYPLVAQILLKIADDKALALLSMQNKRRWTALHYALWNNHTESIKLLLNIAGDKVWTLLIMTDAYNQTPLQLAASFNKSEHVQLILDAAGEKVWALLTMQDAVSQTALHHAAYNPQSTENVRLLLDAAGDQAQTLLSMKNADDKTAFEVTDDSEKHEIMRKYMTTNQ